MATTQSRRDVASRISRAFVDAYNTGVLDPLDDVVASDFVCHHTAAGQEPHGVDGYEERIAELREGFSDLEMSEEFLLVDGDTGAGLYRWGGTHDGEFVGMRATGWTVDTSALTMTRMDGDRTAEVWVYGANPELVARVGIDLPR